MLCRNHFLEFQYEYLFAINTTDHKTMNFDNHKNSHNLTLELIWLKECLEKRIEEYTSNTPFDFSSLLPPTLAKEGSPFAEFIYEQNLSPEDRLILILSIVPEQEPELLCMITSNPDKRLMISAGLISLDNPLKLKPTASTILFLLAGRDRALRNFYERKLYDHNTLFNKGILEFQSTHDKDSRTEAALTIAQDKYDLLVTGAYRKPVHSPDFPAREVRHQLNWEDLVLAPSTRQKLNQLIDTLEENILIPPGKNILRYKNLQPRALFKGPPGTGKTVTAGIIGKLLDKPVYRIDLSLIVDKYVGETEKNLSRLFNTAESKGWILFFDEADSLFSQRISDVKNSNDHYSNLEVNYLLQRIEDYDGMLILGTNHDENIDKAFFRRFDSIIPFPLPEKEQRLELWEKLLKEDFTLAEDIVLEELADYYTLSNSDISSVVRKAVGRVAGLKNGFVLELNTLLECLKEICENQNLPYAPLDQMRQIKGKTGGKGKISSVPIMDSQLKEKNNNALTEPAADFKMVLKNKESVTDTTYPNSLQEAANKHMAEETEKMKRHIANLKRL